MSAKRAATSELNHDNWDKDDPSEHEEMGTFKPAPKEVLEKRVIRTAKRRSQASGDEPNKSVFSGFGGFNKSQPSSFDFLAKLTNGNKSKQVEPSNPSAASSLFGNLTSGSTNGGLFGMPATSTPSKSTFGAPSSQPSVFGGPSTSTSAGSSLFSTANSTANAMFKGPSSDPQSIESSTTATATSAASVFGLLTSSTNSTNKSMFSVKEAAKSPQFLLQTHTKQTTSNDSNKTNTDSENEQKPLEDKDKKLKYYSKLKALNESVSDWIKKHVQETPLCILSPIFKDYDKHLKEIQDEYYGSEDDTKPNETNTKKDPEQNLEDTVKPIKSSSSTAATLSDCSIKPPIFGAQAQEQTALFGGQGSGFSFGIKPGNSSETSTGSGLSFGANTAATSPFSLNNSSNANGTSSFSMGTGKPFSFNSIVQPKPADDTNTEANDDDEPPKVEFTPVVEENSVFDKKCKIFVKKDGTFADKGVGTLYIKTVEGSEKHQLIVRANTNLGNILLNLILTSDTPTQRLGKNNVMMVCIPTPDTKPPPIPILIRVKSSEEADQLLETLNKYKV